MTIKCHPVVAHTMQALAVVFHLLLHYRLTSVYLGTLGRISSGKAVLDQSDSTAATKIVIPLTSSMKLSDTAQGLELNNKRPVWLYPCTLTQLVSFSSIPVLLLQTAKTFPRYVYLSGTLRNLMQTLLV